MGSLIVDIAILSTIVVGLGISILTMLSFHEKRETFEWYAGTVLVFLPLIYSLLSVSMLVIGNIYLYYFLAILVYFYISSHIGAGYFVLTGVVIITYFSMLNPALPTVITVFVLAEGLITYVSTVLVNLLQISILAKVSVASFMMLCVERLFGEFVPTYGVHTIRGSFISIVALIIGLVMTHYSNRYLKQRMAEIDALTLRANKDELTQFYNLYYLYQEFSSIHFNKETLAIAILDLDYFKMINDQYGHTIGNQMLVTFSQNIHLNLIEQLGQENFELYRYGGEEFVVTIKSLPETTMAGVFDILQEKIRCVTVEQMSEKLSFSAGVAYLDRHEFDPMQTLDAADRLLYQSKKAGRSQTTIELHAD